MGQRVKLGLGLLVWLVSNVISTSSLGSLQRDSLAGTPSGSGLFEPRSHVHVPWLPGHRGVRPYPITVQCKEAKILVIVRRDLFGTGRLVKATDLSLGPASCKPTRSGAGETVTFEVGLHECGSTLQMTPDMLVYGTYLFYNATSSASRVIVRSNPAVVPIWCTYPRTGNVSSKAIKPTWAPFSSTISAEQRLAFTLRLMNDDWSAERPSTVFYLGDELHVEASVSLGDFVPMMVFIDKCVATLSPDKDSNPQYSIIDFHGCLVDGKQEDSFSAFRSPRVQPEKLQFTVDAFRFAGHTDSLIYITCNLRAAPISQTPGPLNKACSFSKVTNIWSAVEGPSSICTCCETKTCEGERTLDNPTDRFGSPSRIEKRDAPLSDSPLNLEASIQLDPILLSKDSMDLMDNFPDFMKVKTASHGRASLISFS
ncbi:zona pellucida sperm-binding protein 3 [Microcaecilia unicolor]|uniref:Zona pellucida sperm-binding protein 3 n=1 Tax=Microcaecilia unicolor TaxID=1415580 RepID=A0A6P7WGB7_9AMPH|nr:zona pellucida sperm-binding protein 3-like [Microcaecilia unicolor]